jgi:hypothetical protein
MASHPGLAPEVAAQNLENMRGVAWSVAGKAEHRRRDSSVERQPDETHLSGHSESVQGLRVQDDSRWTNGGLWSGRDCKECSAALPIIPRAAEPSLWALSAPLPQCPVRGLCPFCAPWNRFPGFNGGRPHAPPELQTQRRRWFPRKFARKRPPSSCVLTHSKSHQ